MHHITLSFLLQIATLENVSSFHCSSNELVSLQSLCIELNIYDISLDLKILLEETYVKEDSGELSFGSDREKWVANRFSGKNETVIDDALNVISKHKNYDCVRNGTKVTC